MKTTCFLSLPASVCASTLRKLLVVLSLASGFSAGPALGQNLVVTNVQTITGSETYQSVFIGATNASTPSGSLTVSDGAVVSGDAQLSLGSFANNTGNSLIVNGAGSAINFSSVDQSRFLVGSQGGSSSVLITNGGSILIQNTTNLAIINTPVMVVGGSASAGGNSVVIAGAGSTLSVLHGGTGFLGSSTPLRIGESAGGNEFIVKDGAVFSALRYQVEIGSTFTSSNNTVLYTGAGTTVTNWNTMVGMRSGGNSLTVSDGAVLKLLGGNPGLDLSQTNGVTNTLLVTGAGSSISGSGTSLLRFGDRGVGHVVISNGGSMTGNSGTYLGNSSGASGSSLLVTGSNSLLSAGTQLYIGYNDASDVIMTVKDNARVVSTLSLLGSGAASNNRVIVDAGTWTNNWGLLVGAGTGGGHSLVITNGGLVTNASSWSFRVATNASSAGNSVLVTGADSRLVIASSTDAAHGYRGSSNSMTVEDGGRVVISGSSGFRIGQESTANANTLLVTGAASVFTNATALIVGRDGSSNSLVLNNGAFMRNAELMVSSNTSAIGNSVLVAGAGTVLSNTNFLRVGVLGTGQMQVTNGAVVHAGNTLGVGDGSLLATDGSVWVGQGRPAVQSINVLHANTNSNSIANVNGRLEAAMGVTVGARGVLSGNGTVSATSTTIAAGGTISPGNSPGNITIDGDLVWSGGANYNWQVLGTTDTAGFAPGLTWDLVTVTGTLDLSALSSTNTFNINLWSLASTGPDVSGNISNFDAQTNYEWLALVADDIVGFNAGHFTVNASAFNGTAGFSNETDPTHTFSVRQQGGNLYVTYNVVPEPSTYALLALVAAGFGAHVLRSRRR